MDSFESKENEINNFYVDELFINFINDQNLPLP